MPLPTIAIPEYSLKMPSTGKKVNYRPFVVKEEKMLLMALESGQGNDMLDAMASVVTACTNGKVDPQKSPLFDIEYLFLHLRLKSIGEKIEFTIPCKECKETCKINFNLDSMKMDTPEEGSNKIEINTTMGMMMKYPTLAEAKKYDGKSEAEAAFGVITDCIESIYDEDEVYSTKDYTEDELKEFVDNLPPAAFKQITEFMENSPKLEHTLKYKCPHCGHANEWHLEGLEDFFTYISSTTV